MGNERECSRSFFLSCKIMTFKRVQTQFGVQGVILYRVCMNALQHVYAPV